VLNKFKDKRKKLGLRQLDLAVRSGLSLTTVSLAEHAGGFGLSVQAKQALAKVLRSEPGEIFPEPQDGTAKETLVKGL